MNLSIFVYRGLNASVLILSFLVPLYTSQTRKPDVCSQRGEICLEVKNCVNGKELVKSLNYVSCSVKNFVPGICCKNAINPPSPAPPKVVPLSAATPAPPPVQKPISLQPPLGGNTPTQRPNTPAPQQNTLRSSRNSTAVALENCERYAQYRFVMRWLNASIPGDEGMWFSEPDCINSATLIVNGLPALAKEYPHMALLGYGSRFQNVEWNCGGSLISENFILSAAHCSTTSQYGAPKWALLGDLNITSNRDDAMPAVYSIVRAYDHPGYNQKTTMHDIALFRLNTTVKVGPYVRPACLYTSTYNSVGTRGSITGWGRTDTAARPSDHLLKATISVVGDWRCTNRFQDYNTTTMICAGDLVAGRDTCPGDSGGPLQLLHEKETCMWSIIGVTSYGAGICGNKEDPSVFTNVAFYLDWIQNIVWP